MDFEARMIIARPRSSLAVLAIAALTTGCLAQSYDIPRDELLRLANTPAVDRGAHIHAVQRFSTADEPSPAPAWSRDDPAAVPPGYAYSPSGYYVPRVYLGWGVPYYSPYYYGPTAVTRDRGLPASSGGRLSSGKSSSKDGGAVLVAAIAAGVAIGVGLAITEGLRYDGYLGVHPHHPIHLVDDDGRERIVALDELTPDQIGHDRAILVAHEGAGTWLRDRAPLQRAGGTFEFGLGSDHLALPRGGVDGLGWRFALGYFPTQWMGVLLDTRLAGHTELDQSSWHAYRMGAEVQWYPIQLWRLHLGGFGGAGMNWAGSTGFQQPDTDTTHQYVDFGGLAQIDLTARLALTFRWIEDWLPGAQDVQERVNSSWSLGLAVY